MSLRFKKFLTNANVLVSSNKETGEEILVLFSYNTPVAAKIDSDWFRTTQHYSKTTSKHINKWFAENNVSKSLPISPENLENVL